MLTQANVVIVGGGIVGCSAAYHLTRLGWRDVVVLDKGPLFDNHGSTFHAPGGMHLTNPSRMMTRFAVESVELYRSLPEIEAGRPPFRPVGGVEVATSQARWDDLQRKQGLATAYGVEAHLLTPQETRDLVPLVNPDVIHGSFYAPQDANVIGVHITQSLAREAEKTGGASFHAHTPVTQIVIEKGRVRAVETPQGRIACEHVLIASNIWSPVLTEQTGVRLPLLSAEHQYTVTTPLEALAGETREIVHPIMRQQDAAIYFRQHKDAYGIGNYNHEPLMVNPHDVGETAMHAFTPQHFSEAWRAAVELLPALEGAQLTRKFNGMFAFTVDGFPVMGETSVPGLWTAAGVWITHAGGVGQAIAEWMTVGAPEVDCYQADIRRFHAHQFSRRYIALRCANNYDEVYDIHHPKEPMKVPRNVRLRPMHQRFQQQRAVCFDGAGWELPQWYESNAPLLERYAHCIPERDAWSARHWSPIQGVEHLHVREHVGLFNVAALAAIEVSGPGAYAYLDYLAVNRIPTKVGRIVYTAFTNQRGGIKADVTIARLGEDRFWVLTGGGLVPHDLAWMRQHAPTDGSVHITDWSQSRVGIGIWGPKAREVLQNVTPADVSNEAFRFYRHQRLEIDGVFVDALRVSYLGELGWEFHAPYDVANQVWDALWEAGQSHEMIVAGAGCVDSMRLEKGYRLWGADIKSDDTPYEAGLGWTVRLDKGAFIGRDVLEGQHEAGIQRQLCCLTSDEPGAILLGSEPILSGDKALGYVTSANYGYSIGKFIAYGYLPIAYAEAGTEVDCVYMGRRQRFVVTPEPLFDPAMTRMKA